ncbi:MAG: VWA domain-containing protein [Myxococcales bacterium]|nr:VWA domain-containing protein [Myxococcales bacterium]
MTATTRGLRRLAFASSLLFATQLPPARAAAEEPPGQAEVTLRPGFAELVVRKRYLPGTHATPLNLSHHPPFALIGVEARTSPSGPTLVGALTRGHAPDGMGSGTWLEVGPLPGEALEVTFRHLLRAFYVEGRHQVELPELDVPIVTRPSALGDLVLDDRDALAAMARDGGLEGKTFGLAPHHPPPLAGDLGLVPLGDGRHIVHLRFDVAASLGEAAQAPQVVVLVDRSRSRRDDQLELDRQRLRDLLAALPDRAGIELVPFARRAVPRFGRFVDKAVASQAVDTLDLSRRHGSHLDEALEVAAQRFASLPADSDRRLVILSDGVMRSTLDPKSLARHFAEELTHVVLSGQEPLGDLTDHPWFDLVMEGGGRLWVGSVAFLAGEEEGQILLPAMTRLVRPTTLLDVELAMPGAAEPRRELPEIRAGEGLDEILIAPRPVPWVELRGRIWGRPVHLRLRPNPEASRRAAVFAIGEALGLDATSRHALAHRGHALSGTTRYVIGPPAAPLVEVHWVSNSWSPEARGRRVRPPRVRMGWATPHLQRAQHAMHRLGTRLRGACDAEAAELTMETTGEEIVDVSVTTPDEAKRVCLVEVAWRAQLPEAATAFRRQRWRM